MNNLALKVNEFRRSFSRVPAVYLQHPSQRCAYYISADALARFKVTPQSIANLRQGTVIFTITGDELVDEVPPFNQDPCDMPDVLLRYLEDRSAYLIPFAELQRFVRDPASFVFDDPCVSFIIPGGMELIEELPLLRRGLLQSNTGFAPKVIPKAVS